jgi:hypothetical protein
MDLRKTTAGQQIDYMARDYDSLLAALYALIPGRLPEWTDFKQPTDPGNVLLQLFAHMGDILSYYQDRIVNESFLGTALERKSVIEHLRLIGYNLATATPAATRLELRFPATCVETLLLRRGDAFSTKSSQSAPAVRFEYNGVERVIDCATLLVDPADNLKRVGIDVEEGRLVNLDVLGVSDGSSGQRFALNHRRLIVRGVGNLASSMRDIDVWTELGPTIDASWRLQESLAFSREDQHDYTLETDENDRTTVVFGGGRFGAPPPSGAIVKARYRVGGGRVGNVSARAITTIAAAPALTLLGAAVVNPDAATGGSDRESIAEAVFNAPSVFRSLKRAVTAEDYRALALQLSGVAKVRALADNWNQVTLFVAPEGGGRVSDVLRNNLLAYFEDKRPLSTVIEVEDVDYVKIYVSASIGIDSYYSQAELQKAVEAAAALVLDFDAADFGKPIYLSKFYEAIEKIPGIRFANISEFRREGETAPVQPEGRIVLAPSELPRIPGSSVADDPAEQAYVTGLRVLSIEGGY